MTDRSGKIHKNNCPVCGIEKVSRKRDVGKPCNKCNAKKVAKEHSYKRIKSDKMTSKELYYARQEKNRNDIRWRCNKMMLDAKRRAKIKCIEFDLDLDFVMSLYPEDALCPVLKTPMIFNGTRKEAPSLDRFDNSKGYTKENTCMISLKANILKSDATFEEIEALYHYVKFGV